MVHFVIYDPETGQIKARMWTTDDSQLKNYPNTLQVRRREWHLPLEKLATVDPQNKTLMQMSEEEARVHGATDRDIERGKRRGWVK